jgi:GTP-binding nuclear protein Ran
MQKPEIYKVVFLGDGGVGKSTLLHRHLRGKFEMVYHPTVGAEVYPLQFDTNHGKVVLNIWDTAGQEKYAGLRDGYLLNAHLAVLFYSVDSKTTAKNLAFWEADVHKVGEIPTMTVGTKCNLPHKVTLDTPLVSAKTGEGMNEFWKTVLAKVTGHEDIEIV